MSRKAQRRRNPRQRATRRRPRRRLTRSRVILLLLGAAVLVALWLRPQPAMPLPDLDLSRVEATARMTIEQHLQRVATDPRSGEDWGWLGAIVYAYHFDAAAEACLAEAERLDRDNPRWPHFRSLLWTANHPPLALLKAERASDLAGDTPPFPGYRHAKLVAEEGRWEQARNRLRNLTASHPDYAPALLLLAHAAQAEGRPDRAAELAERCTNDPATRRAAWVLLAHIRQRQGDAQGASEASRQASQLPEDLPPRDPYLEELSVRRGDPREMSILCHTLLASRQLDDASAIIDRLMREHADNAETWLLHGRIQLIRQQPAEAEASLRRHLAMAPDSTQGLFQLGMALLQQRNLLEAADTFGKATQIKKDFGPAWFNRGLALGQAGRLRESLASFEETLRHNPEHLDAYFFLADLHLRLEEPDQARRRLAEAAQLNPDDPRLQAFQKRIGD